MAIKPSAVKAWILRILAAVIVFVLFFSVISFRYPLKYLDIIEENAAVYNIDPALVCAVIHAESKFTEEAMSRKGASGLMQITESTADWMAAQMGLQGYSYDKIFEPSLNISIGCAYLGWLMQRYNDVDLTVASYNAGSGNVDKWLKDPSYSPDGKRLNVIPFKETRDYINRVKMNQWIYDIILRIEKIL